jgi:cell division control protein 45
MALQKALFRVAVSLHDKKAVRNLDHFRWTVVHNNLASAEDYLLTQPMAISRLAQLMIDVSREEKLRQQAASQTGRALWKPKPFLIFAERRNTYLVVGVSCPDQRGEVVKHRFASLFRLAADGCKARYRHDGFDSAVLELDKDSATRFTESLFLACDAGRAPRKGRRGGRPN